MITMVNPIQNVNLQIRIRLVKLKLGMLIILIVHNHLLDVFRRLWSNSVKGIIIIIIIIIGFIHHFLRNVLNQECLYHSAT